MQTTDYTRTARSLHAAAMRATPTRLTDADRRAEALRAAYVARRQLQPRGVFARIAAVFAGGLR